MNTCQLQAFRVIVLQCPSALVMAASISTNRLSWFFYYFTFWGFLMTFASSIVTFKAAYSKNYDPKHPESPYLNKMAVFLLEASHCMNLVITPLFWLILAPYIFPYLKWTGIDLFMRCHMTTLHSFPIICSTLNIVLTDMKLVPEHWTRMVLMGVVYMFANGLGTYMTGHSLYPIADWVNIPQTAFLYILLAFV